MNHLDNFELAGNQEGGRGVAEEQGEPHAAGGGRGDPRVGAGIGGLVAAGFAVLPGWSVAPRGDAATGQEAPDVRPGSSWGPSRRPLEEEEVDLRPPFSTRALDSSFEHGGSLKNILDSSLEHCRARGAHGMLKSALLEQV